MADQLPRFINNYRTTPFDPTTTDECEIEAGRLEDLPVSKIKEVQRWRVRRWMQLRTIWEYLRRQRAQEHGFDN